MDLNDRLEEIRENTFYNCRSLRSIVIPPAVKTINEGAVYKCSGLTTVALGGSVELKQRILIKLTNVTFWGDIEEFASSDAMRGWWNQGVHERSL